MVTGPIRYTTKASIYQVNQSNLLLFLSGMMKKADLLSSQICMKFEIPEEMQRADVFLSPKAEQVSLS